MDQEMKSLILDAATGDSVMLMNQLDGTDMQLNEIAHAVHQSDMRFDGIENVIRQTDMQLNEIANAVRQTNMQMNEILCRLQEASSSQHQQHHGWMAVLAGALITAYTLIALV